MAVNRKNKRKRIADIARRNLYYDAYAEDTKRAIDAGGYLTAASCYAALARQQVITRDMQAAEAARKNIPDWQYLPSGGISNGYITTGPMVQEPAAWPFTSESWVPSGPQSNIYRAIDFLMKELERLEIQDEKLLGRDKPKKKSSGWNNYEVEVCMADTSPVPAAYYNKSGGITTTNTATLKMNGASSGP